MNDLQAIDALEDEPSQDEVIEAALDFLAELLAGLQTAATITVSGEDDRQVAIRVQPQDDASVLIGQRGQTLHAIQYLMNVVFSNKLDRRIQVDVGDFRQKQSEAVDSLVADAVARVRETGKRVALDPMSSQERKAVHQHIADNYPDMSTYSTGEDPDRHLVIEPKGPGGEEIKSWQGRGGREMKNFDSKRGVYRSRQPR